VLDFDGVLTDNRVLVQEDGTEAVYCSREDGLGLEMLRKSGRVKVVVISKEKNPVVAARCRKLGIECIQSCDDKLVQLKQKVESRKLKQEAIAYVGNDVNDLECLRWVGLPIAVCDAAPEVLAVAKWKTAKPGGHGAVREICDLLLKSVVSSQ
jgi:YrbI family 3-deoxy-D-manno-octulosonate 8-phosphate phosphatase